MSDRWQRVGAIFDAALVMPTAERERFVRTSGESKEIQDEVLSLLVSHEDVGTFLEEPASQTELEPLSPGTVVGTYRIARILGQGGMGIVYEAEDERLHRRVALKSVAPRLSSDERLRLRLWQEARAAAALSHPGIATVYALEEIDGQIYIASEYVEGHTLREEIDRGPLPVARALATARDIARALVAAHERGIVHRDLKPENLMRTVDGGIKILDFGLAQIDPSARRLVSWTRLTDTGLVAGTPPYMAPEQLLGQVTDARTDLFALGVIVYEMVAGRHAFGGSSLPSTIARILAGEPQPLPLRTGIPDGLWPFLVRCLQKDPAERFATSAAVLAELELLLAADGSTAPGADAGRARGQSAVDGRRSPDGRADDGDTRHPAPSAQHSAPSTQQAAGSTQHSVWWWQFHQLAAALIYWFMVWPAWHVHDWMDSRGLPFFLLTLCSTIVAGNLRLHLWFSSRIYPTELANQRAEVSTWIRSGDYVFAATLLAGGIDIGRAHAGWGGLFIAFAIGSAVAFLVIEPATARAAFGRHTGDGLSA